MVENQSQKGVKESHSVAFHQKTGLEVGGRAQTVRQPADDFPDKIKSSDADLEPDAKILGCV